MEFVRESMVSIWAFINTWKFTVYQLNGTARPSLALENLQEMENLEEPEREKAEEVIAKALGSLDLGE
jgi:hypothetical protein